MTPAIPLSRWPAISLTIGILAVATVATFAFCRHEPTPIPPKEATTRDSLAATQPAFQARVDTLRQIDSAATRESHRMALRAAEANHRADSLHAVAIAAEASAEAATNSNTSDSAAALWHASSDRYKAEAAQRLVSYDSLHAAYAKDSTGHVAANSRADATQARNVALVDFSARLESDLAKADPPCRVAVVLKCPSRRVVAVAGIGLGVLAKVEYDRLRKQGKS